MKGIMRLALFATVAALAATVGATKAEAGLLTCGQSPEYPFAQWGDRAPYSLAPNGGLESGDLELMGTAGGRRPSARLGPSRT